MAILDDDEEEDFEPIKPVTVLFNKDYESIRCFRRSGITGILTGFGLGLTTFMFTSNVAKATRLAVFSSIGSFTAYYFACFHFAANDKFTYIQLQKEMQRRLEERGVQETKQINPEEVKSSSS